MSIDDKMERLYRERRLTERRNSENPSNKNSTYEGFAVAQEEYIQSNATQSEPMDFCPECNGMMLPYLDGHKCKDCGYTKGVSEELIKKSEEKEKRYTFSSVEIKPKVNDYKPRSRIIKPKEEVAPALSSQELKDTLSNLDDDTFDVVASLFGVPKSLEKEEKIDVMIENHKSSSIERNIQYAQKIKP